MSDIDPKDPKHPKNQEILHYIISKHAPLIKQHIAYAKSKGMVPEHVQDSDLISAGAHGLLKAFHTYDPKIATEKAKDGDNLFTKHAGFHIKSKIYEELKSHDPIHRRIRQKMANIKHNKQFTEEQAPVTTPESDPEKP